MGLKTLYQNIEQENIRRAWQEYRQKNVRKDISRYIDASAAMERLGLAYPMWFYDANLDGAWGTSYPMGNDRHCVLVDLVEVRRTVREVETYPSVRWREDLVGEQLPDDVPFTFENFLRADLAHELSHLRDEISQLNAENPYDYANRPSERRARICGRELYQLVRLFNPELL